ncbi:MULTISPECIES: rhodanese-like domain-containing protein [unclassified Kosmotoga]|uniref:rhodanese-like domain-containing protein n=1 Tax=unclassified Kosmotoga TaxID=2631489 RepID=UPI000B30E2A5|nr:MULTISPECIES: rhodanese-like domain-containing protein [unclassified Kosmotoga]MDI3524252.1 hypothetical protein [Kosmotoga sp.]MDK2953699.1 hypothetical protein [Kosmotoga sp.]
MKIKKAFGMLLVLVLATMVLISADKAYKTVADLLTDARSTVKEITVEEAYDLYRKKASDIVFLDVREAEEVEAGHIPGATWIPRGLIEFKIEKMFPDRNAQVFVVYCKSGGRSLLAAKTLQEMGYEVMSVKGGFTAWKTKRFPIRRGLPSTSGGGC